MRCLAQLVLVFFGGYAWMGAEPLRAQDVSPASDSTASGSTESGSTESADLPVLLSPEAHPPVWSVGGGFVVFSPLLNTNICPAGADCVFTYGGGLRLEVEHRWSNGFGIYGAYGLFWIDSDGVFEIGTNQLLELGVRYSPGPQNRARPVFDLGLAFWVFGDTLVPNTVGGAIRGGVGLEYDLSATTAFTLSLHAGGVSFAPFSTQDGAARSNGFGIDVFVDLTAGLSFALGDVTTQ